MAEVIWSIIAVIAGFAVCGVIFYFLLAGREDRDEEERAREFFDRHGHWPGEDPT